MRTSARYLGLLPPSDALRLALRAPRGAAAVLRDAALGADGAPFPRRIGIFLTDRCNFACEMCAVIGARDEHAGELPFTSVERIYRECDRYGPVIDLIGGEPLLYQRIADVIALAGASQAISALTTNGLLLQEFARPIVDSGLPMLQVSLDGWDEESQRLRGRVKGSFARIVEGIQAVLREKGRRAFPIVRVLTAITRHNYAHLDDLQQVVHGLGVRSWGVANYFYVTESAMRAHRAFVLAHGLNGPVAADAIHGEVYLSPDQVAELRESLRRVRARNRALRMRIAYNWDLDLDGYYSPRLPSQAVRCDLPYGRLDVHADGSIAVCVSGKTVGHLDRDSLSAVWRGTTLANYRRMYEASRPMPMCFRCCGMSNVIRFDSEPRP
jgi:MoaA/NifB/PqqE/SkfB family radical SAM enzyme